MSRRIRPDRNVYIGSYSETPCRRVDLPFTPESLVQVLEWGAQPHDAPFTHQEIANWCAQYFMTYVDEDRDLDAVADILNDVDAQWDLYQSNCYSLEELQSLDFSKIELPRDWFEGWLEQLRSA
jgi:hypothetical protein